MRIRNFLLALVAGVLLFGFSTTMNAQTRDEKVRSDREKIKDDAAWYYDDLEKGLEAASKSKKPLMVVLRCIP